jgi:hypothetical protein
MKSLAQSSFLDERAAKVQDALTSVKAVGEELLHKHSHLVETKLSQLVKENAGMDPNCFEYI